MEPKKRYEQFRDIMGNVSGASYLDVKYFNTIYKHNGTYILRHGTEGRVGTVS